MINVQSVEKIHVSAKNLAQSVVTSHVFVVTIVIIIHVHALSVLNVVRGYNNAFVKNARNVVK